MDRDFYKKQVKLARERFEKYSSFENLLFISELLDLESKKYGIEKQKEISIDLSKISFEVDKIMNEIF